MNHPHPHAAFLSAVKPPKHNASIHSDVPFKRLEALKKHVDWFECEQSKDLLPIVASLLRFKLHEWRSVLKDLSHLSDNQP
jgi:hypothetical protein